MTSYDEELRLAARKFLDASREAEEAERAAGAARRRADDARELASKLKEPLAKGVGRNVTSRLFVVDGVAVDVRWTGCETGDKVEVSVREIT